MIPASFIQDLLARVDVAEVVGRHVQLKKKGANYLGLCPFHGEKSPSFTVSPTKQFYHCFGCGANGNAIGFLMEHLGMGFVEAVRDLAQQVGMAVPEGDESPEERARQKALKDKQSTLSDTLARAAAHYYKQLKIDKRAQSYLQGRGLSGEICKRFGIGYAPEGWRGLASVFPRYDDPLLAEAGLVIVQGLEEGKSEAEQKRYDRFRDRIMFPIRSVQGEVIGFGGRVLDKGEPKYLNSPETPVFVKGRELYGLYEARAAIRDKGYALVVEGYMDVVALAQLDLPNAVATLGTACTAEHVHKLLRHTEHVVFSFDGDAAGRRAAARALEAALPHATDTRTIKFLFLPSEHDPDSYVREHGTEAFESCVAQAVPLSRQFLEQAADGCDLETAEGRARLLSQARPLWAALPDGALRRQLLLELAERGRLRETDLTDLWKIGSDGRGDSTRNGEPARRSLSTQEPDAHAPPPDYWPAESQPAEPNWPPQGGGAPGRPGWRGKGRDTGYGSGRGSGRGRFRGQDAMSSPPMPPRRAPSSPPDNALRLLLAHNDWWWSLNADDHLLLHELPAPHGELVAWLERHLEHHGNTPWDTLRAHIHGEAGQELAERLMAETAALVEPGPDDLRQIMNRLWVERLNREAQALAASAATDPQALGRLREIHERIKQLNQPPAPPPGSGS